MKAFSEWLLAGTNGPRGPWTLPEIEAAVASGAREDAKLARPVPVAFVYMTGYATPDGTAHFRDDVYGLDREAPAPAPVAAPAGAPGSGRQASREGVALR